MAAVTVMAMGMPPCSLGFSYIVPRGGLGDKAVSRLQRAALGCIIGLVIVLALGFAIIGLDTKVTFLLASVVVGIFLVAYGYKLEQVMTWYIDGGKSSIELILILMSVGTVIGTWMASGTVPTIIYYGLKMLTPTSFMIIGFLLCCLVSFFVGSSYSTLATLGVAFVGIGTGLGMNLGLVGGMVLSGAMFGDKMSPFSDTTNLAPAVSGTTVYRHINSMIYTVTPTMIISFALYTILSMKFDTHNAEMTLVDEMIHGIEATYNVTPLLLIVPVFVLTLALFRGSAGSGHDLQRVPGYHHGNHNSAGTYRSAHSHRFHGCWICHRDRCA